jgi:hypothetical protein
LIFAIDEADQRYWREKGQEEAQREPPLEIKVQQT